LRLQSDDKSEILPVRSSYLSIFWNTSKTSHTQFIHAPGRLSLNNSYTKARL